MAHGEAALTHACETFLRSRGYTIFCPKLTPGAVGAHPLTDSLETWIHTLLPSMRNELLPVVHVIIERIRMRRDKEKLPLETLQLRAETHSLLMNHVSSTPGLIPLLEGVTFRTIEGINIKQVLNRPDFPHDWHVINSRPVNCQISMENHVRKCTSRVKKPGNLDGTKYEWTANNFAQRSLLPLPPIDQDRNEGANLEVVNRDDKGQKIWLLEDGFGDATCMAMSSKWSACGLQILEGDGVFVWDSADLAKGPQWRLGVGPTYAVAFDPSNGTSATSSTMLATGGTDDLRLWTIEENAPPTSRVFGGKATWDIDWAWFGSYFCTAHHMKACLWATCKTSPLRVFAAKECGIDERSHIDVCRFHPTASFLGVAGEAAAAMWDVRDARPIRAWLQPKSFGRITSLAFSEDGLDMAIGSDMGFVATMDLRKGQQRQHRETFDGPVWALGYEGTGELLVGGDFGLSRSSTRSGSMSNRHASGDHDGHVQKSGDHEQSGRFHMGTAPHDDSVEAPHETVLCADAQIIGVSVQRDGSLRWGGRITSQ